jgi:uncharacterized membrane protein
VRSHHIYLLIALPVAAAFALLTPPMQTPDEVGHYWRSTAIAHGDLVSPKHEGRPSSMLPLSSRRLVGTVWMEMAGRRIKYEPERLRRAWQLRNSEERTRLYFPAFYTALPYTPQATALAIARLLDVRPLAAFYLGRLANALAGVLLVMLAMRLVPQLAWAFGIVGLTPMFLYLAGSFSADTTTAGLAFSTAACALRLWREEGSRPLWIAFAILALLLALAKPAYVLLPLLALPLVRSRRSRPFLAAAALALAIGVAASAWTARVSSYDMRGDLLADPAAQLAHVTGYPHRVAKAIVTDYAEHAYQYFDHFVGRLGWLDIGLPRLVMLAYALAFVFVVLSTAFPLSVRERSLMLAIFGGTLLLVSLSQYLIWTPVASDTVGGIQGRYFLPVGPLLLIALSTRRLPSHAWVPAAVAVIGNGIALATLFRHYY